MKEYEKKPQPSSRISGRQTHASRQAPALEVLQRYKNRIQENETGNFSTQGIIQRQPIHGDNFGYDFLGMPILNLLWGEGTPGYQERLNIGNRNGFHLGWQSLMGFNTNNNQFSFNQLRRRTQEPYATTHAGRQIVTRGVSSCSVIIISHNGNHAMAHLDARDLTDENIDFLLQQVPSPNHTAPVHPHIFISIHNRPEGSNHSQPGTPARFARNLIESYYPRTPPNNTWNPNLSEFLTQGIPAGHNIRVVDRSNEAHTNMFTHPEIGLAINPTNGQLDIFGQIAGYDETRRPRRGVNTHFTLPLNAPQESFDGVTTRGRINLQGASLLP